AAYANLIRRAVEDDEITKALTLRPDTPDMVVRELLSASPRPAINGFQRRRVLASISDSEATLRH
ncbi:hypothetical protein Bra1253DRAFT_00128, partial [Bradyrhizobium sp. WSM1253]